MRYQKFIPEGWFKKQRTINSNMLDNAIKTQEILEAKVTECDENYNLLLDFGENKKGIINRNEIELIGKNDKTNISTSKVNKYVQFKVKGIDESNNYILSRKDVEQDAITWLKNDVKEGNVLKGIVKSIQPYGAFVEIGGGVVGLVHIEDMSVARIKSPKERLHIGQKINIMVKSIDKKAWQNNINIQRAFRNMGRKYSRHKSWNNNSWKSKRSGKIKKRNFHRAKAKPSWTS